MRLLANFSKMDAYDETTMADDKKNDLVVTEKTTCLDDVPRLARLSLWQQRISRSYHLVALVPFVAMIFIVFKFFPNSTNPIWTFAVFLSLGWAIAVAGYAFYSLFWGVRSPACGNGFGVRDSCRSCGLPRHQQTATMFDFANKVRLFEEE
jgi:hypothetical protein